MRVLLWLVEGTWQGCVDAARPLLAADAEVTLLYVAPSEIEEAVGGAVAGLLGRSRPRPGRDPAERISVLSDQAAAELLAAAEAHLGRLTRRQVRRGRVDRLVVEAAQDADLLVVARDGDRHRLGPASLGPATRFVVDHAPCPVLLVWPDQPPAVDSPPAATPAPPIARTTSTCDLAGRRAWLLTGAEARALAPAAPEPPAGAAAPLRHQPRAAGAHQPGARAGGRARRVPRHRPATGGRRRRRRHRRGRAHRAGHPGKP